MKELEEGNKLMLDFEKIGKIADNCRNVIPVAVQDANTDEIILVAYTNELAFNETMKKRVLVLWSTSRNVLWEKGKTSGETFKIVEAFVNCEQNSLVYKVIPNRGKICHTNNKSGCPRNCYYRKINLNTLALENIDE